MRVRVQRMQKDEVMYAVALSSCTMSKMTEIASCPPTISVAGQSRLETQDDVTQILDPLLFKFCLYFCNLL